MAAGNALDAIGERMVQIFYQVNSGRFLLLPLECKKWETNHYPILLLDYL
jgi:hypothetical protein